VQNVIDFDKIEEQQWAFEGTNVGFCALGTTRAQAGKVRIFCLDSVNIAI
jgi:oxidoreductase